MAQYTQQKEASGWTGWIYFASFMMIFVGIMHAISGLVALFNDQFYVVGPDTLWLVDVTKWGWAHLILGILVAFAGGAVMSGKVWGRTLGVILAGLSAIANFAFIPVYPLWAITVLVIDVIIIFALTAHGREVGN